MSRLARRMLLLALPAGLAACSTLLQGKPPPKLYTLEPASGFPPGPRINAQLLIDAPTASGAIDTERIALMKSAVTVDYFADAAWTDRAPVLVQNLLVQSFENSDRIGATSRDSSSLRPDFVLLSELREFAAVYATANPTIHVRLGLKLIRLDDRRLLGQRQVEASAEGAQDAIVPVVTAFDAALRSAMTEIVTWSLPLLARA